MNLYQFASTCPGLAGRVSWDTAALRQPRPYAVLHVGTEGIRSLLHGGARLVSQDLNISLFHAPGEQTPGPAELLGIYEWLQDRTAALKHSPTGRRYSVVNPYPGQPPTYDPETQGLTATVSFSVQFTRPAPRQGR